MQVKAIATGFDGAQMREPGDVFEVPDGSEVTPAEQGGWYVAVKDAAAKSKDSKQSKADDLV